MSAYETKPGSLDDSGHTYKRRMNDERLQNIADSAYLKVLQYIITAVALPLLAWGMNTVLGRLDGVERALYKSDSSVAVYELRLQTLERAALERDTTMRLLTEKVIGHDYELKSLKRQ